MPDSNELPEPNGSSGNPGAGQKPSPFFRRPITNPLATTLYYMLAGIVCVAGVGVLCCFGGIIDASWQGTFRFLTYSKTDAVVTGTSVRSAPVKGSLQYWPVVNYRYEVEGHIYESDRFYADGGGTRPGYWSKAEAENIVAQYRPGQRIQVYYNGSNPSEAFLDSSLGFLTIVFSFLAPVAIILPLVAWIRRYVSRNPMDRPTQSPGTG
jgi:Protein of unknown function (DUF3592)